MALFSPRSLINKEIPDRIHEVRIVPSKRAKRMSLRVDARQGDIVLSLPLKVSVRRAESFILKSQGWIEAQRRKQDDA